jgi:hypothetical protein
VDRYAEGELLRIKWSAQKELEAERAALIHELENSAAEVKTAEKKTLGKMRAAVFAELEASLSPELSIQVEKAIDQRLRSDAPAPYFNAEDEDAPQLHLPDAETNFALVGPYKPAAGFEVIPVPSLVDMQAGLHLRTGFMRDRRLVQLFDYPQGWQEGTVMRRCVRKGKPSNVYDIKYADGFTMTQECDPDEYGATNGKKWCIIQPIQRDVEGSDSDAEFKLNL